MPEVTGFQRPTFTTIHSRIQSDLNTNLPGSEARLRRSVLNVLSRTLAGAIHLLYGFGSFIAQNIIIDTSKSGWLARQSSIWGITRIASTFSEGFITISVRVDSGPVVVPSDITIPIGTVLQRADGQLFTTQSEVILEAGTPSLGSPIEETVSVISDTAGVIGNTDPLVSFSFLNPPSSIELLSLVDDPGIVGGQEEESDESLRARLLLRIQEPPMGGTANDYISWSLQVAGVTRVWVFPLELGMGTVVVRFVKDGNNPIVPTSLEVEEVQDYIDERRPVTADVTVLAPVSAPIDLTIAISPDTSEIRNAIQLELEDMFLRDGEPGVTIFLSRIRESISVAPGEFNNQLQSPVTDITHSSAELPQLGTITWGSFS